MILLAALLSFGWPALKVEFVPRNTPLPPGMFAVAPVKCCGSMRPALTGIETVYAERYTNQPLLGTIVSTNLARHQVVAENKTHIRTSGIANRRSDPWTPKTDVKYIVRYILR